MIRSTMRGQKERAEMKKASSRGTAVFGRVAPGYEGVRDAFTANLDAGMDIGASFAVYRNGEALVDLWGGHVDGPGSTLVAEDTLFSVWSTTKGLTALCIAMLVDRGRLAYEEPVAAYWPEFAAAGKGAITVGQLMSHQAGLTGTREPVTLEDYYGHDRVAALLAAQEPYFRPGRWGYHAVSFGTLAEELVRRVDGRTIGRFFAEEIAGKLGLDVHFGLQESEDHRQATMVLPTDTNTRFFDPPNQAAFEASVLNPLLEWNWPARRE
jgi:CubicO group peptidase (beta-lactamase class C family)